MTERNFTPPTEFPTDYIDGIGRKITIYAMGHGQQPLLGQNENGDMVSFDLTGCSGFSDKNDLHDIPKRITKWHNVYDSGICSFGYSSRKMADKYVDDDRVCVYCIAELEGELRKAVVELNMLIEASIIMQASSWHNKRQHNTIVTDTLWSQWSRQLKIARTNLAKLKGKDNDTRINRSAPISGFGYPEAKRKT